MAFKIGDSVYIKHAGIVLYSATVVDPMPGEKWVTVHGYNLGIKYDKEQLHKNVVRVRESNVEKALAGDVPCCNVHGGKLVRRTGKRRTFHACPECDVGWWERDAYKTVSYPANQAVRTARLELCKLMPVNCSYTYKVMAFVIEKTGGSIGRLNFKECQDLTRICKRGGVMRFDDWDGNCWRLSSLEGDEAYANVGLDRMPGYCNRHAFDPVTMWCGFCGVSAELVRFGTTKVDPKAAFNSTKPTVWREIEL